MFLFQGNIKLYNVMSCNANEDAYSRIRKLGVRHLTLVQYFILMLEVDLQKFAEFTSVPVTPRKVGLYQGWI